MSWFRASLRLLSVLIIAELGARIFLGLHFGALEIAGFPSRLWFHYYPSVRPPTRESGGDALQIGFLGASVLSGGRGYGEVGPQLARSLVEMGLRANVHNYSAPAHTSLDAVWKYRLAGHRPLDWVVLYEGFNEARANNCPRNVFQNDYGHMGWYRRLQLLERHSEIEWIALPFTAHWVSDEIRQWWKPSVMIPLHEPRNGWTGYGHYLKSPKVFAENVRKILDLAHERGERIILVTQAYSIPLNYSREAFRVRGLDYNLHLLPIELWGEPEAVRSAVNAHNQILKDIAREYQQRGNRVWLVDLQKTLVGGRRNFNDVCHLTDSGSSVFARALAKVIADVSTPERRRPTPAQKVG